MDISEIVAIAISSETKQRLESLARATGRSVDKCLALAVEEFIEGWEVHLNDLSRMEKDQDRPILRA